MNTGRQRKNGLVKIGIQQVGRLQMIFSGSQLLDGGRSLSRSLRLAYAFFLQSCEHGIQPLHQLQDLIPPHLNLNNTLRLPDTRPSVNISVHLHLLRVEVEDRLSRLVCRILVLHLTSLHDLLFEGSGVCGMGRNAPFDCPRLDRNDSEPGAANYHRLNPSVQSLLEGTSVEET